MKVVSRILITVLAILFLGYFYFLHLIKSNVAINRNTTDAIVVLGDARPIFNKSVELLKQGYAPLIFYAGTRTRPEFLNLFIQHHLTPEQFVFDQEIQDNTISKNDHVANFLIKYKLNSIRVIGDAVQMPRIKVALLYSVPKGTVIILHPMQYNDIEYKTLIIEYLEYVVMLIAAFLGCVNQLYFPYD